MYQTTAFRGSVSDPTMITDMGGKALFDELVRELPAALKAAGVPHTYRTDEVKSGNFFRSSYNPILIISHPNPPSSFYDIGFLVNENVISFPLLGESKQHATMNRKNAYIAEGKYIKAALFNPDEFILQQERAWQAMVMRAFGTLINE